MKSLFDQLKLASLFLLLFISQAQASRITLQPLKQIHQGITQVAWLATIQTERLLLRPVEQLDLADCNCLFTKEQVMDTYSFGPWTQVQISDWLEKEIHRWHEGELLGAFAILLVSNPGPPQFLGMITLETDKLRSPNEAWLAYALFPEYWNQGLETAS